MQMVGSAGDGLLAGRRNTIKMARVATTTRISIKVIAPRGFLIESTFMTKARYRFTRKIGMVFSTHTRG
jgi:tRNA(Leu) C34 or U34 (ribose-2'-O)-methylase TrmL